ncbi:MAG: hypothetical protein SF052_13590 [Bacteroidia bacterium]|nr:hypothetical protein [Bacteroidia bacterium]
MEKIKYAKYTSATVFLLLSLLSPLSAQQIEARLSADTSAIQIGDQVNVSLTVRHAPDIILHWPLLDSFPGFEILSITKVDSSSSPEDPFITQNQRLTLTSFDSGSYRIPAIDVFYFTRSDTSRKATFTNALPLEVHTVAVDTTAEIKPIKDIRGAPLTFREVLPYILVALLVAALVWFVIRRIKRRPKPLPVEKKVILPSIPPHEIAMRKLAVLEEKRLWQKDLIKEYYSELTDIFREYLENKFKINALESTTGEIISSMQLNPVFKPLQLRQLEELLTVSDLVKFAKAKPASGENLEAMEVIRNFVKDTSSVSEKPTQTEPVTDPKL